MKKTKVDPTRAAAFLESGRIAVVGASDVAKNFGGTIYRELRDRGRDVVAVNPSASTVAGDPCYPNLAAVPGSVDMAIVMVSSTNAIDVVNDCATLGIPRVWLFRGLGGAGAVSDEAIARCREAGISVVAGACPLMFPEPVQGFHRFHRTMRHLNRSLVRAG